MFKEIRQLLAKRLSHTGGLDEKKQAIKKVENTTARINELCEKMDARWHVEPVQVERRHA